MTDQYPGLQGGYKPRQQSVKQLHRAPGTQAPMVMEEKKCAC